MKINLTINRYRIYKVLKWIFAVLALTVLVSTGMRAALGDSIFMGDSQNEYLLSIVYIGLAIFFKLQEDSNKPTVEE